MTGDVWISDAIQIPASELQWSFVRSSGPGGQNVNKVNSKAVVRWAVRDSESLPDDVRRRFLSKHANRINQEGELILTSQRHRDQPRNAADCVEKLRGLVLAVENPPRRRRPTKPSRGAIERRLERKRQTAQKKSARGKKPDLDG